MKPLNLFDLILSALALGCSRFFNSLHVSPSLGAKSGVITSPSGDDANMRTLGDVQPPTATLAGIVRAALALAAAVKGVVINFATGKAVVVPTGYADPAPAGSGLLGTFTKDDPSKASSPWTFTPEVGADPDVVAQMEALVAARKPSLSVESLTNGVEDITADAEGALGLLDYGAVLHYDQADGLVKVVVAANDNLDAYDPAAAYAENAAFVRTVAAAGSTQFGE
jgi:hypothetical protein